ncbi:hypothetical protein JCM19298_2753 [Nonlabens ulvanivorans]|nr:hypothetical protein JCM19298_2753 [Nonlabens ulvanivorans]|tara:strand:- start:107 stop:592 length:486 start_codon:yes stop_codon:yes gene_type:complete
MNMKNIKYFNTLLRIILIVGIAICIIAPAVILIEGKLISFKSDISAAYELVICELLIQLMVTIITLISVNKLRIATENFYRNQLFNNAISRSFKQIGYLIIIATLSYIILQFLAELYFNSKTAFGLNLSYLLNISATLFFFTLSTMVDKAKGIQQENDLTI